MRDLDDFVELKLPELKQRERPWESRLRDALKDRGVMFVKLKPTVEGFPDRFATGYGRSFLVEIKRDGEDLSETQRLMHEKLRKHGTIVILIFVGDLNKAADYIVRRLKGFTK